MSKLLIQIDSDLVASGLASVCNLSAKGLDSINQIENFIGSISGGVHNADVSAISDAVSASATLTVSSTGSVADETCSIANVTLTAKASGASTNQFNVSTTPATQAANIAACINASPNLAGIVSASANGAVVTITSLIPGKVSNGLQISESLTNVALVAFSGGSGALDNLYQSK